MADRRIWSLSEKRLMCSEVRGGASAASVARKHGANANRLYAWLKDDRFNGDLGGDGFLRVAIEGDGAGAMSYARKLVTS